MVSDYVQLVGNFNYFNYFNKNMHAHLTVCDNLYMNLIFIYIIIYINIIVIVTLTACVQI